jgi:hypothetical protein
MILINLLCFFFFFFFFSSSPLLYFCHHIRSRLLPHFISSSSSFFFWVVFVSVVFATGLQQNQTKQIKTKQNPKNKLCRHTTCKKENHGFKLLVILATTKEKRDRCRVYCMQCTAAGGQEPAHGAAVCGGMTSS